MPGTCAHIGLHVVFATKHRQRFLADPIALQLHEFIRVLLRDEGVPRVRVGGVEDHVHIYLEMRPHQRLSDLMRSTKAHSSRWLRHSFPPLRNFRWQTGYAAFSVSINSRERVEEYIANQREHHRTMDSSQEIEFLLQRHGFNAALFDTAQ